MNRKCPQCNKEIKNDNYTHCPHCGNILENVDNSKSNKGKRICIFLFIIICLTSCIFNNTDTSINTSNNQTITSSTTQEKNNNTLTPEEKAIEQERIENELNNLISNGIIDLMVPNDDSTGGVVIFDEDVWNNLPKYKKQHIMDLLLDYRFKCDKTYYIMGKYSHSQMLVSPIVKNF